MATIFSILFDVESLKRSAEQSKREVKSLSTAFDDVQKSSKSSTESAGKSLFTLGTLAQREFQKAQAQVDNYKKSLSSLDSETKRLNNRMLLLSEAKSGGTVGFVEFRSEQAKMEKRLSALQKERERTVTSLTQAEKGLLREERNLAREQDKLAKSQEKVNRNSKQVDSTFNKLASRAIEAFSVYQVFSAAISSFKSGAEFDALGASLDQISKNAQISTVSANNQVSELRKLGFGASESRRSLAKLVSANIDYSKSTELAKVAQDASVISMTDANTALDRITQAITSGNSVTLKTLSINADYEKSYRDLAKTLGKTKGELTETERVTARVNAVLEGGKGTAGAYAASLETAEGKLRLVSTSLGDLTVDLGSVASESGILKTALDGLNLALQGLNSVILVSKGLANGLSFDQLVNIGRGAKLQGLRDVTTATAALNKELEEAEARGKDISFIRNEFRQLEEQAKSGTIAANIYLLAIKDILASARRLNWSVSENAPMSTEDMTGVRELADKVKAFYDQSSEGIKESRRTMLKGLLRETQEAGPNLFASVDEYNKILKSLQDELDSTGEKTKKSKSGVDQKTSAIKSLNDEILRLTLSEKEYQKIQIENKVADYLKKGASVQDVDKYRQAALANLNKSTFDEATRALQEFESKYQQVMKNTGDASGSVTAEMDKFKTAAKASFERGVLSAEQYNDVLLRIDEMQRYKLTESSTDFSSGLSRGFTKAIAEANNFASVAENLVTNSFRGMEDAFVKFAQTGKLEFSSLANSIISDMMRIFSRMAITGPLSSLMGAIFGGGISPGSMPNPMGSLTAGGIGNVFQFHTGEVAGIDGSVLRSIPISFFDTAERYHTGGVAGLKSGEVPIIAMHGESIFTEEQSKRLASMDDIAAVISRRDQLLMGQNSANGSSRPVVVNLDIQNSTGQAAQVQQRQNSNGDIDIKVVLGRMVDDIVNAGFASGKYANALEAGGVATYTRARR